MQQGLALLSFGCLLTENMQCRATLHASPGPGYVSLHIGYQHMQLTTAVRNAGFSLCKLRNSLKRIIPLVTVLLMARFVIK